MLLDFENGKKIFLSNSYEKKIDYWAVIENIKNGCLEKNWDEREKYYFDEKGLPRTGINASILTVFAIKAGKGKINEKEKERAVFIIKHLLSPKSFERGESRGSGVTDWHLYGWHEVIDSPLSDMGPSIDNPVIESLYYSWKYRQELGLSQALIDDIVDKVRLFAEDLITKIPTSDNQENIYWYKVALFYSNEILKNNILVEKWLTLAKETPDFIDKVYPGNKTSWLWPDFTWNYNPEKPQIHTNYFTSAYSNNMFRGFLSYSAMKKINNFYYGEEEMAKIKAFQQHVLGNWQLNGYLNWDESHRNNRQHILGSWIPSFGGLLTMIFSPDFNSSKEDQGIAKSIFDSGINLYLSMDSWEDDPLDYCVSNFPYGTTTEIFNFASKIDSNAYFLNILAIALDLGLEDIEGAKNLNSIWRYDWNRKRLLISTRKYNTAIIAQKSELSNEDYGGIEIARLLDSNGRVLTNLGGFVFSAHSFNLLNSTGELVFSTEPGIKEKEIFKRNNGNYEIEFKILKSPAGNYQDVRDFDTRFFPKHFDNKNNIITEGQISDGKNQARVTYEFYLNKIEVKTDTNIDNNFSGEAIVNIPVYSPNSVYVYLHSLNLWNYWYFSKIWGRDFDRCRVSKLQPPFEFVITDLRKKFLFKVRFLKKNFKDPLRLSCKIIPGTPLNPKETLSVQLKYSVSNFETQKASFRYEIIP